MRIKITNIAGMNGYIDPAKLSESEFQLLENYTLKSYGNVGSLVSRPGIQRYGDTQIASGGTGVGSGFEATLNGTDYMITNIINGGSSALYYKQSPYSTGGWTAITGANGSAQGYKLNYASFKDKVYIANRGAGIYSNQVWDGTTTGIYDMGCPPPSSRAMSLASSNSNGRLSVNTGYFYYVTFLYDGFQESPIMSYTSITTGASDDTVTITNIPTTPLDGNANARIIARKLYRLKSSTGVAYYLDTITNNTDTSYIDYKADNELAITIDLDAYHTFNIPYYSKYITIHKERSFLGGAYSPNIFTAPTGTDISLTGSDTGGSVGNGVYKYRFYFANEIYDGTNYYSVYLSPYVEKTINMGAFSGTDNSISINFSALTDRNWFDSIYIERTSSGGGDFIRVANVAFTAGSYTDTTADGLRGVTTVGFLLTKVEDTTLSFPGLLRSSDAGKPDLFSNVETAPDGNLTTASNEWNIGEPITGIHSEENRIVIFANNNIHELDTRSQSRIFWNTNKIVSGIGADDGLQVQCGNKYIFVKSNATGNGKVSIYEWDGRNEPQLISLPIQEWIETKKVNIIKSLVYDQYNNRVIMIATGDTFISGYPLEVFVYNLDIRDNSGIGRWEIWVNETSLNLNVVINTKNRGIIYGGGDGYIHNAISTSYRDSIAGSGALFTTKLRTKTFETFDSDLMIKNFRADITSTGAITPSLKTAVDGTLNSGDNMPALASGFNRPRLTGFTNAQGTGYRQVYFQLEMSANEQHKVHGLMIDFEESAGDVGGR